MLIVMVSLFFVSFRVGDDEKEYLVKWKELPYDECYWESESDIASFQQEIERFNRIKSRRKGSLFLAKQKSSARDVTESKKKQKEFQHYERSPEFLSGGMYFLLHIFGDALCISFSILLVLLWFQSF